MDKIIITTSWDDNHEENIKLAELLTKYQVKGTFYLTKFAKENLEPSEIKEISLSQEIGAHTLNHVKLTEIFLTEAQAEISGSKDYLESIIGSEIKMFAYPFGSFNKKIKELVKSAGFLGARTTKKFIISYPSDFFEFDPTLQIYPYPLRKKDANHFHLSRHLFDPLISNFSGIKKLNLPLKGYLNWKSLAKSSFDKVMTEGGIWHLWGHTAELEKYNLWQDLEEILKYIAAKNEVLYLTNSQVLEQFS